MTKNDTKISDRHSPNSVISLCILRLSAIGDVTHVLPVVATLQHHFPDCEITWIIGKLEHKLMQGLPGVRFVIFDKNQGRKAYVNLKKQLSGDYFDVLLQMQYSFRANRAAWKIRARQRIGFDPQRSREFHGFGLTDRIRAVDQQHVLDSFLEFPRVLGIKEPVLKWPIVISDADEAAVEPWIKAGVKNVIISPCSSVALKNWSNERYAAICDHLVDAHQAHVILCSGPSAFETETVKTIENLCQCSVTNIAGQDTLKQLFALMKKVDLVISPDSGPMHMASAANTPVIGLHATSNAKRSGPYRFRHLTIDKFDQAVEQFLHKTTEQVRWGGQVRKPGVMDLISVDEVKQKIDQAFEGKA